ncbi:MAG: hypothetical protein ABIA59_01685, partial [Candidatus Latescibacterota bacterium]
MSARIEYRIPIILLLLVVVCSPVRAQWTEDGVLITTSRDGDYYPRHASDGGYGAFVVWRRASGENSDIWSQRIEASGVVAWQPNGVAVCSTSGEQDTPHLVADGAGGAIIVWQDKRLGDHWDIFAQRISPDGNVMWSQDGIALCAVAGDQFLSSQCIVPVTSGNVIVAWHDERSGSSS